MILDVSPRIHSFLPKLMYKFSTIPIKITAVFFFFFAKIYKLIQKFLWKYKGPRTAKTILKKKTVPKFKAYYEVTVIKMFGTGIKRDI